jgi:hypothetical protein
MDFFQSHQTVPKYLTFFHIPERSIALVKRLAGSPKGLKLIPTCPTLTKCYSRAHAFLYTLMDFFQSHQTVPKPLLSYLLPYSRTFNCTSKTTGWFTKGLKLIPTCPTLTKCVTQGAHAFLYTLMDFFHRTKLCPAVAILPSSIFPNVQLH